MKVFRLEVEGSSDFYLFVKSKGSQWTICSNLNADKSFISSGSAGQACPAHPRNKINKEYKLNDWFFNKAEEDDNKTDWEEGGVVVKCSVHEH